MRSLDCARDDKIRCQSDVHKMGIGKPIPSFLQYLQECVTKDAERWIEFRTAILQNKVPWLFKNLELSITKIAFSVASRKSLEVSITNKALNITNVYFSGTYSCEPVETRHCSVLTYTWDQFTKEIFAHSKQRVVVRVGLSQEGTSTPEWNSFGRLKAAGNPCLLLQQLRS